MDENNESEQVSDQFICAVCLDLLYKPIVLVCGHVTCFWCCHYSMDMRGQSHCPLCRHPYNHFPAICQLLDVFLKKMYPVSYNKRKSQTLADEEQIMLGDSVDENEELNDVSNVDQPSRLISDDKLSTNPSFNEENISSDENHEQVTVADVSCGACSQLLFRPAVLNCGHVFCEGCIMIPEDGVIKCQVCQFKHPSGFPKVCKELDCALEEKFSSDYAIRKNNTQISQEQIQNRNSVNEVNAEGPKLPYPTEENFLQWWTVHGSKFHPGVGCDMCGMCPIIGDRYQCKDCTEKSGYDLCGDCHNTNSKLPGRFNQKHTQEHRLELVNPTINHDVIFRLVSGQLALVSAASRNRSNPAHGTSEIATSIDDDGNDDGDDVADDDGNDNDDGSDDVLN